MKLFIATIFSFYCFVQADYDESLAMKLVHFAAASFIGPGDTNADTLTNQCFTKAYPNSTWETNYRYTINNCANHDDNCQGLITSSAELKMAVFAFRGTVGMSQLLHEGTDWKPTDYTVHDGQKSAYLGKVDNYFLGAMLTTWETVKSHIDEYNAKNYTFYFTGHSLGGAIAALTALSIVSLDMIPRDRMVLYTYGEPRIGDYTLAVKFQTMMAQNKYRVVHYRDPVPHFPFCKSKGVSDTCVPEAGKPYHHPEEVWYNNGNQKMDPGSYIRCSPDDGEYDKCSDSISDWNFILDGVDTKGSDFHNNYFNHRLDKWGPAGCNSASFISFSSIFVLFSFFILH
uniref:Fungal lipase-like domain-containing protein n=1 Tax=Panagrolaimus sp. JU765 TaxID=591449 RepID=A0AC34QPL0_9BILA